MIQEEFLYFLWASRLFTPTALRLTTGESIDILHPGFRNSGSGPDFTHCKVRIDGLIWAGSVEIHVRTSDWNRHRHQFDPAYNPVILHVVHTHDTEIKTLDGHTPPTLVLNNAYDPAVFERYTQLTLGLDRIPCASQLQSVPEHVKSNVVAQMLVARLHAKTARIRPDNHQVANLWPSLLFTMLGRAMGFNSNSESFEWMCRKLPFEVLQRNSSDCETTEALLFGISGLLTEAPPEPYVYRLLLKWERLQRQYQLTSIPAYAWKFGSIRPSNFPTRRIAQFAAIYSSGKSLFDVTCNAVDVEELIKHLDVSASDYWQIHYRFGQAAPAGSARIGRDSAAALIINAIAPFLFYYGQTRQIPLLCEKALFWLEQLSAENNRITRLWERIGMKALSAAESQALIQLKLSHCDHRLCSMCGIGQYLIRGSSRHKQIQPEMVSSPEA